MGYLEHSSDGVNWTAVPTASPEGKPVGQQFYRPQNAGLYHCMTGATEGERTLRGMLAVANAFRFIEKLYDDGAIDFTTRRQAGLILCDTFLILQDSLTMYDFSRCNHENAGVK